MTLCKYYEKRLLEFCSVFKPAMPRSVVGTACMYFKRFYLNNSVMEYHPRIIMLTCAFLACKVDEFNVSSLQFVGNLRESPLGQEKALEQILEYELLLIQQLNFHLIVHNPYRPFEGFLIDLKTRYPMLENPEILRKTADDFLNRVALTDAYLLYTPSQIALTAILSSASRAGITMERTSNAMLNKSGESGTRQGYLILRKTLLAFPLEYDVACRFIIYDLYYVEVCSLYSHLAESLYQEWVVVLSNPFSACIDMVGFLSFILFMWCYYINCF
uniref:Cyclin-H n=1 Tax=Molossus molossus TaxID=27622 RepID=A0A7J8IXK7_MOLMO|nr:cyclin H [Molossus molossus]